jgi:hypothetical protein
MFIRALAASREVMAAFCDGAVGPRSRGEGHNPRGRVSSPWRLEQWRLELWRLLPHRPKQPWPHCRKKNFVAAGAIVTVDTKKDSQRATMITLVTDDIALLFWKARPCQPVRHRDDGADGLISTHTNRSQRLTNQYLVHHHTITIRDCWGWLVHVREALCPQLSLHR